MLNGVYKSRSFAFSIDLTRRIIATHKPRGLLAQFYSKFHTIFCWFRKFCNNFVISVSPVKCDVIWVKLKPDLLDVVEEDVGNFGLVFRVWPDGGGGQADGQLGGGRGHLLLGKGGGPRARKNPILQHRVLKLLFVQGWQKSGSFYKIKLPRLIKPNRIHSVFSHKIWRGRVLIRTKIWPKIVQNSHPVRVFDIMAKEESKTQCLKMVEDFKKFAPLKFINFFKITYFTIKLR